MLMLDLLFYVVLYLWPIYSLRFGKRSQMVSYILVMVNMLYST